MDHNWRLTWSGMYDSEYICTKCGKRFMEQYDYNRIITKPKGGCNVNKKKG